MTKQAYEAPLLAAVGSFKKSTGFLSKHGKDRLVLSKNHFIILG